MLTNPKKILRIIAILLIIFLITYTYMRKSNENNNETNTDSNYINIESLKKEYNFDGLYLNNIKLYSDENESNFTAQVENKAGKDLKLKYLDIIFYDKNESIILEKYIFENETISNEQKQIISFKNNTNLKDVYKVDFEVQYK